MYLHLGNDAVVCKREVLAIFDLDNTSQSHITRSFLARAEKQKQLVNAAGAELPKSFVLADAPGAAQSVYLCQLNSSTLSRRAEGTGLEAF